MYICSHWFTAKRTPYASEVPSRVPEKVAMAISGHKTRSVFDRLAERKAMIDRAHPLPIGRQCQLWKLARSTMYYQPPPVSDTTLALMRRINELHLRYPFAGARMLHGCAGRRGSLYDLLLMTPYELTNSAQGNGAASLGPDLDNQWMSDKI
jgi:hypothetical protein